MEVNDVRIAVPLHNVTITHRGPGGGLAVDVGPGAIMLVGATLSVFLALSPPISSPDDDASTKKVSTSGRWVARLALLATTAMAAYGGIRLTGSSVADATKTALSRKIAS
eukprot:TRINITY_DN1743_c0_g3_i1.p1 TRINITY_DN1743_c0_g3~~TRINITY_DN1743_c0_g3_i1.p1  ORF type:complete len:110 (+),score=27.21 TRINITY_DN1743_c0_g3_i1:78-407(+)